MTARGLSFSHLLFVDDVIIIGEGSIEEWKYMKYVIQMFCKTFELELSSNKSILLHSCNKQSQVDSLLSLFPFNSGYIDDGLRYLVFHIKPNGYGPKDRDWLLKIIN